MDLQQAVAIVTGGNKGIGRGLAEALAREGTRLVVNGRDSEALEDTRRALVGLGAEVETVAGDVGDPAVAARLVSTAVERWGRLDLVVNNAGVGHRGPVTETPIEVWDEMFRTNVRGPFLLVREAVPHFRRGGGGAIVNVSSLAGKNPVPGMAGYAATKWALDGFSASILGELRDDNIRIVVVHPGSTASGFHRRPEKLERQDTLVRPEDIGRVLVAALQLPDRAMVSEIDIRPTRK